MAMQSGEEQRLKQYSRQNKISLSFRCHFPVMLFLYKTKKERRDKMRAVLKREIRNYFKNPLYWIGIVIVMILTYQMVSPYLSVRILRRRGKYHR